MADDEGDFTRQFDEDAGLRGGRYDGKQQDRARAGMVSGIRNRVDAENFLRDAIHRAHAGAAAIGGDGGSTATITVILPNGQPVIAQLGDSPAYIIAPDKKTGEFVIREVTKDHTPEALRGEIEGAGGEIRSGRIMAGNAGIAVGAGIGDSEAVGMKRKPDIFAPNVSDLDIAKGFFFSTTDGVPDELSKAQILETFLEGRKRGLTPTEHVKLMINRAQGEAAQVKSTSDNMSGAMTPLGRKANAEVLGVFDGHGGNGREIARVAADAVRDAARPFGGFRMVQRSNRLPEPRGFLARAIDAIASFRQPKPATASSAPQAPAEPRNTSGPAVYTYGGDGDDAVMPERAGPSIDGFDPASRNIHHLNWQTAIEGEMPFMRIAVQDLEAQSLSPEGLKEALKGRGVNASIAKSRADGELYVSIQGTEDIRAFRDVAGGGIAAQIDGAFSQFFKMADLLAGDRPVSAPAHDGDDAMLVLGDEVTPPRPNGPSRRGRGASAVVGAAMAAAAAAPGVSEADVLTALQTDLGPENVLDVRFEGGQVALHVPPGFPREGLRDIGIDPADVDRFYIGADASELRLDPAALGIDRLRFSSSKPGSDGGVGVASEVIDFELDRDRGAEVQVRNLKGISAARVGKPEFGGAIEDNAAAMLLDGSLTPDEAKAVLADSYAAVRGRDPIGNYDAGATAASVVVTDDGVAMRGAGDGVIMAVGADGRVIVLNDMHPGSVGESVSNALIPGGGPFPDPERDFADYKSWNQIKKQMGLKPSDPNPRIMVASDGIYGKVRGKKEIASHAESLIRGGGLDPNDPHFASSFLDAAVNHEVFQGKADDVVVVANNENAGGKAFVMHAIDGVGRGRYDSARVARFVVEDAVNVVKRKAATMPRARQEKDSPRRRITTPDPGAGLKKAEMDVRQSVAGFLGMGGDDADLRVQVAKDGLYVDVNPDRRVFMPDAPGVRQTEGGRIFIPNNVVNANNGMYGAVRNLERAGAEALKQKGASDLVNARISRGVSGFGAGMGAYGLYSKFGPDGTAAKDFANEDTAGLAWAGVGADSVAIVADGTDMVASRAASGAAAANATANLAKAGQGARVLAGAARAAPVVGNVAAVGSGAVEGYIGHKTGDGRRVAGAIGTTGGALSGAALGAAFGTAVFPGVGTVIGGAIGGFAGAWLGDEAYRAVAGDAFQAAHDRKFADALEILNRSRSWKAKLDHDGSGRIDLAELRVTLDSVGITDVATVDLDGDGEVSKEELWRTLKEAGISSRSKKTREARLPEEPRAIEVAQVASNSDLGAGPGTGSVRRAAEFDAYAGSPKTLRASARAGVGMEPALAERAAANLDRDPVAERPDGPALGVRV